MKIRKAKADDASAICRLLQQLGYSGSGESITESIDTCSDESEILVAVEDGNTIAFMSLIYFHYFPLQCHVCRITAITVDSSVRGCGIGSKLMEFAFQQARKKGCKQLEVTTSLTREKTQKYYEFLGFNKASYRYYQTIDS